MLIVEKNMTKLFRVSWQEINKDSEWGQKSALLTAEDTVDTVRYLLRSSGMRNVSIVEEGEEEEETPAIKPWEKPSCVSRIWDADMELKGVGRYAVVFDNRQWVGMNSSPLDNQTGVFYPACLPVNRFYKLKEITWEELPADCQEAVCTYLAEQAEETLPCCPPGCGNNDLPYCHCQHCGNTGIRLSVNGYCSECAMLNVNRY